MDKSIVRKQGIMPAVLLSFFLVFLTTGSHKVEASTAPIHSTSVNKPVQLAWWGPGYYYNRGYYNRGYYGWGYNRGAACAERCWRNRWGNLRCGVSCY